MEIRDIKERLSLQQVLSHYKLKPDKNNRLNCPFHEDKTPSMQVYFETNTVYCFSANCKTHGKSLDVIDFIMFMEKCNKHDAILKAQEIIGISKEYKVSSTEKNTEKSLDTCLDGSQANISNLNTKIITKIFKGFRKGLQSNLAKNPNEYLQQRSLNPVLLEVGYNSGQFHHHGRLSEEDFEACINAGLLVPYKGCTPNGNKTATAVRQVYSPFANNCIIFPLKDKSGNIVSIYGRSLSDKKGEKHYYLKSRSGLYPGYLSCPGTKPETRRPTCRTGRLILTEAVIDAATLLQLPTIN